MTLNFYLTSVFILVKVATVQRSLSTLQGVFFPVALSMCSVAVFMRVGFIVGNAGVFESIGVYLLAFSIFLFTGLSVCAISTNGAIQGGGIYCKYRILKNKNINTGIYFKYSMFI